MPGCRGKRTETAVATALINGLFARTAGPAEGQVLVLVHAFGDSSLSFLPLLETSLADRFRLIAIDLAGFGASPRRDDVRTLADHADTLVALVRSLAPAKPAGLVAHSVASMIAVEAAQRLGERFGGLFSIEGNLTAEDAYFSGRAADFDDPGEFKRRFLEDIRQMAQTRPVFRRYFDALLAADPTAMWNLGRDARRLSVGDEPGRAYSRVRPSLYYWSAENTTESSRRWIEQSGLDHRKFTNASHWPMVDQPAATASAIDAFYAGVWR